MNILNNDAKVSEVVLPVIVDGYKWECNNDRMWNLNELHKAKDLPDNKLPSEWDNAVKTVLLETGNFRVERDGKTWCTLATEAGAIAYAMWVSTDFYLTVVNAFIFMRNDAVIRERVAIKQADEANVALSIAAPKAEVFDGRLARGGSVPWNWACKALGLAPVKLKAGLLRSGKFTKKWDHDSAADVIQPVSAAFHSGHFVRKMVMDKNTWQVTARGYAWMHENAQRWRELIAEDNRAKAKAKRRSRKMVIDNTDR